MLISTAALLLLWGIISYIVDNPVTIPTPLDTLKALFRIVSDQYFVVRVFESLKRIVFSFMIAFGLGLVLGLLSGAFTSVYYLLKPLMLIQRAVPTMGVILLALIWLDREIAPILVCVLVVLPIIYSAVVTGVREIDPKLMEMTSIYTFSNRKKLKHLYIPSIWTSLVSVSSSALSLNVKIAIAAEVLSQPKHAIGTGFVMEKVALETAGVLAWSIIAISLVALFQWLIEIGLSKWKISKR